MARITKTGGRKPITEGKLCMSRFKGAVLDAEAGVTSGFRLLVPLDNGRRTGYMSLNLSDLDAERIVKFFGEQLAKGAS